MTVHPDSGSIAGSVAALCVLTFWAIARLSSQGTGDPLPDSVSAAQPEPVDAEPLTAPTPQDFRSSWEKDPRWDVAWELGEAAQVRLKKLWAWQDREGGDPFYFRSETKLAQEQFSKALGLFDDLEADFGTSSGAVAEIRRAKSRFSRALANTRSKGGP